MPNIQVCSLDNGDWKCGECMSCRLSKAREKAKRERDEWKQIADALASELEDRKSWFYRGVYAARAERNASGCGCELDGEGQVISPCMAHKVWMDQKRDELRGVLREGLGIIDAHVMDSLSCDNDGERYCGCLEKWVEKARRILGEE